LTNVIVVVGAAAVVDEVELRVLVDASDAAGFVNDKAPHDLAKEIHNF
jgi:hypothetical protein